MPYIKKEQRAALSLLGSGQFPDTPGQLNYVFTQSIGQYLDTKGFSYKTFNDVLGALEGAKLEFYHRMVRPYEDKKCKENGDVY